MGEQYLGRVQLQVGSHLVPPHDDRVLVLVGLHQIDTIVLGGRPVGIGGVVGQPDALVVGGRAQEGAEVLLRLVVRLREARAIVLVPVSGLGRRPVAVGGPLESWLVASKRLGELLRITRGALGRGCGREGGGALPRPRAAVISIRLRMPGRLSMSRAPSAVYARS